MGRWALQALEGAGIGPDEVDEISVGHFNEGFSRQACPSSLVLQSDDRFRFKPATRVENACASGSAAVYQGLRAIASNAARFVLVVGVEKMTGISGDEIGNTLLKASYLKEDGGIEGGFAGVFGHIAQQYFQKRSEEHTSELQSLM